MNSIDKPKQNSIKILRSKRQQKPVKSNLKNDLYVAVKKKSKQFETIIYLTDHAEKAKGDHQSAASNKSTETFKII